MDTTPSGEDQTRPLPPSERRVPDKPSLDGLEARWDSRWEEWGTYRFDRSKPREQVFSIDTPPPTVSGSLHVGHVFSYTHTDTVARFQRMRGREVFYPMGWDDNGLPTERRVQNYYGVLCDPSLPYDPDFTPPERPFDPPRHISRRNFVELCALLTAEDEKAFEHLWRMLGLSVDWTQTYATIDEHCSRVSQRAFLRNLRRGEAYQAEAPVLWDVDFRTAVAQAELEDREVPGAYHRILFTLAESGEPIPVDTTRPELIPACVALVAHPDDERYRHLFSKTALTPLFGVEVPIHAHPLADPEKGTGIAMICTFGDVTDVVWWRELGLPARCVLRPDGTIDPQPPEVISSDEARARYAELAGLDTVSARRKIAQMLRDAGVMEGDPRPITHAVKFFEKGDRPLEIMTTRQWYIRNGARDEALREALLERGRELQWHPDHMRTRYETWVEGLNSDWLISRQRFFGVPFPVWYAVDEDGNVDYSRVITPDESRLPVDPTTDVPDGYDESQRGKPGGFVGEADVMDTWATSSLTPQIATHWEDDPDLFSRTFPMDLRPQAHEIIRTWLFSTVLRAHLEHDSLPWRHAAISGWVLDPDRKKMSKSKGNVVTPVGLIERYGADAVRYWAASGRPGTDTAFDEGQIKIGRRLAIKVLNVSRFVLGLDRESEQSPSPSAIREPLDLSLLACLADVVDQATKAFDAFDYARALERTEAFFWEFCDDYVELVKARAYGERGEEGAASARACLETALSVLLRLFAPFLPFCTEEVWSWWHDSSVHRSPWPSAAELARLAGAVDQGVFRVASEILSHIRRAKSDAKVSLRTPVETVHVVDTSERVAAIEAARDDLVSAGCVRRLTCSADADDSAEPLVDVRLARAG
ncbi:MAG: valine--tRNA ligase [Acidimicrobiales bacterium]|nr:MAG: valine--tRNA ligase [Acidimicrobiales bacterium]